MGKTIFEAAIERVLDRRQPSYTAHIPERRQTMANKKKREKKPSGELIADEFYNLRDLVGQHLQFLCNCAYWHEGGRDYAFQDAVQLMSESALSAFNTSMKELADEFEGLEFEPFKIDGPQLVQSVRAEDRKED